MVTRLSQLATTNFNRCIVHNTLSSNNPLLNAYTNYNGYYNNDNQYRINPITPFASSITTSMNQITKPIDVIKDKMDNPIVTVHRNITSRYTK